MRGSAATCCRLAAALGLVACVLASAGNGRAETLVYELTPQPYAGTLAVELTWQVGPRSASRLCMSERFGTVQDGPGLIRDLRVEHGVVTGRGSGCWALRHRSDATLRVHYAVTTPGAEFSWETSQHPVCTDRFFHGIGNTFLLVPQPGHGGAPAAYEVLLRWRLPRGWRAVCSWGSGAHIGAKLDVNDLRHSVYLAGPLARARVDVAGADSLLVAALDAFDFDADALAQVARTIIADQCQFMREPAFPEFVITAIPVGESLGGAGQRMTGKGLHNSLALLLSPDARITSGLEHLLAHELFHYWNGRMLRAAEPAAQVDWFIEGFTDYYALRLLHDTGRWSDATYADWINRHVRGYFTNPTRDGAASADPQRAAAGRVELPYQQGLLLGIRWHHRARAAGISEGIDRLLRALVARGRQGTRLSNRLIRELGRERLGSWFEAEFDRYIRQGAAIELSPDVLAPALTGGYVDVCAFELGFDQRRSQQAKRVVGLRAGSAAAEAGLREGDEITGWRIHAGDVDRRVRVHIMRDGRPETIRYYPRGAQHTVVQFRARDAADGE